MRYTLVFVFVLLVAVQSFAADMLDDRTDYIYEMRRSLGYDTASTVVSTSDGIALVKQSAMRACVLLRAIKDDNYVLTSYKQSSYSVDSLCIEVLDVFISKNDTLLPLRYAPRSQWSSLDRQSTVPVVSESNAYEEARKKRPQFYDYIDNKIYVFPVPTIRNDTIHIICSEKIPNIDTATSYSAIPVQYRQVILDYAVMRAAYMLQHPLLELFKANFEQTWNSTNQTLNSRKESTVEVTPNK